MLLVVYGEGEVPRERRRKGGEELRRVGEALLLGVLGFGILLVLGVIINSVFSLWLLAPDGRVCWLHHAPAKPGETVYHPRVGWCSITDIDGEYLVLSSLKAEEELRAAPNAVGIPAFLPGPLQPIGHLVTDQKRMGYLVGVLTFFVGVVLLLIVGGKKTRTEAPGEIPSP